MKDNERERNSVKKALGASRTAANTALGVTTAGTYSLIMKELGEQIGKSKAVHMTEWEMEDEIEDYGIETAEDLSLTDLVTHPYLSGVFETYTERLENPTEKISERDIESNYDSFEDPENLEAVATNPPYQD